MDDRCAGDIPGGKLVTAILDGTVTLCLKAHRQSKDYVNHYLVPLAPPTRNMALIYVDPDTPLRMREGRVTTEGEGRVTAEVGTVVVNAAGAFLKVFDTARADRHFCYVNIASGEVRQRQEREVMAVLCWRLDSTQTPMD